MKRFVLVFSAFVCIAVIFGFTSVGTAAEEKITIKITNWFPVGTEPDVILVDWGKELEKRSGGKIKVNYYGGGTLVPAVQSYDAAFKGIVDVGNCVLGNTMGRFPFCQALDLPIGSPIGSGPTFIHNEFYKKFKPKELDDVKVLWMHGAGGGFVATRTKRVTKLEDMQGLKLRCYGSNAEFVKFMGAAPVAMPMPEVYDALSKGVVDGLMTQYQPMENFRTGELVKYVTESPDTAYTAAFAVVMNKRKFESLPPDVQKIIDQISGEYVEKFDAMWTRMDAFGKEWVVKKGVEINVLSPDEGARWYEKGSKPIVEAYIKDMKAKGLPGEEAVKFVRESFKKYRK